MGFQAEGVYVASGDHMLRVEFAGTQGVKPVANQMPSGDGQTQPLGRITYTDLWPGISLSYEQVAGGIAQSSYLLEPGADVCQIRLCYNAPVKIEAGGSLRIGYETGQMRESAPVAWQDINGRRIPVEVTFCLLDSSISNPVVSFRLGQYNTAYPLMIDPTLQWHTFMGSTNTDGGRAIAVGSNGNMYVAGWSYATWGIPVNAHAGNMDIFVAKLDSSGSLQWNTFMGSSNRDIGDAIALDESGNLYVAGYSDAPWGTPVNAFAGYRDAFVAKLDSSGTIQWHTFMGSTDTDEGNSIALDGSGNVYVAGYSEATWGTPMNAYTSGQWGDAFAAKLDSSGSLQWNTFMGSTDLDYGRAIAVDDSGNVHVTGSSYATWGTPVNPHAGDGDAFVAKLDNNGSLQWNTFMGSDDDGSAIALDGSGNVYVAGDSFYVCCFNVFAAKLDSSGSLQWKACMGSFDYEHGYAIAVDDGGNVYVAGDSYVSWGKPVNAHAGEYDAFAAKIDSDSDGVIRCGGGSDSESTPWALVIGCFIDTAAH